MSNAARAFVGRHTELRPVPGVDGIRLHLATAVLPLWRAVQLETGDPDAALPYWGFAWGGGLAIARYLQDCPETVRDRRVLDFATGSGLCAIAAMRAGAAAVMAVDIDPFAIAATERNARAARYRVNTTRRDPLDDPPPDVDVILAGDCWYSEGLAARVLPWLRRAHAAGIHVIVGDPNREHLPLADLDEIAAYDVRTTTELEDLGRTRAWVYVLRVNP